MKKENLIERARTFYEKNGFEAFSQEEFIESKWGVSSHTIYRTIDSWRSFLFEADLPVKPNEPTFDPDDPAPDTVVEEVAQACKELETWVQKAEYEKWSGRELSDGWVKFHFGGWRQLLHHIGLFHLDSRRQAGGGIKL